MNESYRCPKCGQPVPQAAPEGLCPRCLGALNLDLESSVTGIGAAIAPTPPSATELAPHFPQLEILEVLGRGGMGVVYKVRQKELDRIAALKILPPGIGGEPAFAERFAREAKALARLNHPGIVTIYDSGRADGLFYFLMEFMDGVSLARLMHGGRVSPREALAIVPQICDALQYAHDQGIVHRDIKPENILLDRQGRVKVADFGLAKLLGTGSGSAGSPPPAVGPQTDDGAHGVTRPTNALTEAGKVMGTPAYMAPEQVEHPAEVDHRADIYALGVVFYQMLTGELPGQRLDPPSKKVQIDVRLDEVVLRALEKEPERRYQQVSQVKTAVETILQTAASAALKGEAGREGRATPSNARTGSRAGGWLQYAYAGVAVGLVVLLAIWLGWRPSFRENTSFVDTPTNQLPASPQTVDEVLARYTQARGGLAAAEGTTNLIVEGTWESRDGMGTLQIKALLKAPDKWMLVLQDENGPVWQRAFDGAAGWEVSKWGGAGAANPATLLTGRILMGLYRGEQLAPLLPNMSLKGKDTIRSREVSVLDVALPQGLPARLWFETQTGLLVRIEYGILGSQLQLDLDDYRDIGGLMVPFTMRQTGSENWTVRCRAVKRNEPIEDGRFKRPASE